MRAIVVGVLALFWVQAALLNPILVLEAPGASDFSAYYYAARVAEQGGNPYDLAALQQAARQDHYQAWPRPYFYPPFFAQIMRPLAWLEVRTARLVWLGIATLALWCASRLMLAVLEPAADEREQLVMAILLATFFPIRDSMWIGQANEVVLLALAAWLALRRRGPWAGGLLGVAMAIKMSPALLLLFLVSRRAWREAGVAVVSAGAMVLVAGVAQGGALGVFVREVLGGFLPGHAYHRLSIPLDLVGNHSLAALAYQVAGDPTSRFALGTTGTTVQVGLAAALLGTWAWRARRGIPWEASLAGLVVLMVILPTYAYEHHLEYLVIPLVLTARLARCGSIPAHMTMPLAVAYALLAMPVDGYSPLERLLAGWPILAALAHLPKLFPMLLLFFTTLAVPVRAPRQAEATSVPMPA
jgi:hypothetical protein